MTYSCISFYSRLNAACNHSKIAHITFNACVHYLESRKNLYNLAVVHEVVFCSRLFEYNSVKA